MVLVVFAHPIDHFMHTNIVLQSACGELLNVDKFVKYHPKRLCSSEIGVNRDDEVTRSEIVLDPVAISVPPVRLCVLLGEGNLDGQVFSHACAEKDIGRELCSQFALFRRSL